MLMKYVAGFLALGALTWAGSAVSSTLGRTTGSACGSCCVLEAPCCNLPQTVRLTKTSPDCCYPGSPCCYPGSPCCDGQSCCYPGSPCCYPGSPCCDEQSCCGQPSAGCCGAKK